jgi:uncharacterized protein YcfJ
MKTHMKAMIAAMVGFTGMTAAQAAEFEDYARVTSVTPQVERISQPEQRCRTDYVQQVEQPSRSAGGAIVGGIAGAILGNQVGKGNGRTAATAAGAVTGAIVGDRIDNRDGYATVTERPVQRCHTVERVENRIVGYNVTYEYRGRSYSTVTPYDPGDRLRLHVSLTPQQ